MIDGCGWEELLTSLDRCPTVEYVGNAVLRLRAHLLPEYVLLADDMLLLALTRWLRYATSRQLETYEIMRIVHLFNQTGDIGLIANALLASDRNKAADYLFCIVDYRYVCWTEPRNSSQVDKGFYDLHTGEAVEILPQCTTSLAGNMTKMWFDLQDRLNEHRNSKTAVGTAAEEVAANKATLDGPSRSEDVRNDPAGDRS